jgi:uncharacterized Fe-S cluster-containing radical SAM superfamily protein
MENIIDTEKASINFRLKSIDLINRKLLVSNLIGSEQEKDLKQKPNCEGFGRIRHFTTKSSPNWPLNPLPIQPACKALGLSKMMDMSAQVFQNAVCNWRCWYCFVPFNLLSGDLNHSKWFSSSDLINMYLKEDERPYIIDLSGGQPDLIPEWVPWMMNELRERNLEKNIYLWSDDNMSNDYFWKYLSDKEIELVRSYKNYGRVCCFKGFDGESFSFNTRASPDLFDKQFQLIKKFIELDIDVYAYATFTSPNNDSIQQKIKVFVDKLQIVDENLPLRLVPLEIIPFTPVKSRTNSFNSKLISDAIRIQQSVIYEWQNELKERYSDMKLSTPITEITFKR